VFVEDKPVITNPPSKHPVVSIKQEGRWRSKHLISHVIFFLRFEPGGAKLSWKAKLGGNPKLNLGF